MDQILISINEIIEKLELKTKLKEYNCDDNINKGKYIYFAFYNKKIIYIGKSENIKKRVLEHFKKPANSTTSALKLEERIHLYGLNLRLSFVEVKTEYYDLVMHKIEQELRKKYNPIVGKH